MKDKEFGDHLNAQIARIAADDSRKLSLPATPEAYQIALPADFKAPDGIDFKFNDADPLLAQAKTLAHQLGIPQEGFSKLLGLYAGSQVQSEQQVQTARNAEMAKLGPTATARVDAIGTFMQAMLGEAEGKQVVSRIFTASDVTIMEKLVAKFASQGTAGFSQQHRDHSPAGKLTPEQYDKLSYSAQKEYAAKFPQQAA